MPKQTTKTNAVAKEGSVDTAPSKEPKILEREKDASSLENKKGKSFSDTDLIECKSVTSGELIMVGKKSGSVYKWADYGDIEYVEYRDLLYATRSKLSYITAPLILILDDVFVSQNKELSDFYSNVYIFKDVMEILDLPVDKMKEVVAKLPQGIKNAIKGTVATLINNDQFDSLKKIKALDEVLGTMMVQTLADS